MKLPQLFCGLFGHRPQFSHYEPNGVWMYRCRKCKLQQSGYWFKQRKEKA